MMPYIWKEYLEQIRGKGLWLGLAMMMLTSLFLISEARSFPDELGFQALLLSIFDMNIYLIPLFALFLSSFSFFQEKELKTEMILLTKKESFLSFVLKKSISIQLVIITTFMTGFLVLAIFMKFFVSFDTLSFLVFLLVMTGLLFIFNQLGVFLGTLCKTKMQLVGADILVWFFSIFLLDLVFLYFLPAVTFDNVQLFSWLYFLDPLHSLRFFLETKLQLFSLNNLSTMMEHFVFMSPTVYLMINLLLWPILFFVFTLVVRKRGDSLD